jgi:signal transduction histidine kinase
MFKLLRYYSLASLLAIMVTAIMMALLYRQVAMQGIVQLAERNNITLARAAMSPIQPALLEFLVATADRGSNSLRHQPLPPDLERSIRSLMQDRSVVKIKIFNRHGVVAFSTRPDQIGDNHSHNYGFITALRGGVGSAMIFRDTFNSFDRITEEDNLAHTYIPIRASPTEPVQGVFELYSDVNKLVHNAERAEFTLMFGAILILTGLYTVLTLIVRHANSNLETQQRALLERTRSLELLSEHMLRNEESQKKNVAFKLHEGLAQTLAAVKLQVENNQHPNQGDSAARSLESIIPVLQVAIQEVRTIATDLRPPSLDDLGLLLTLNWLCREFELQHPGIRIERQITIQEQDIPPPLKVILYRIVGSVLEDMAQHKNAGEVHLALWPNEDSLVLLIDDTPVEALDKTAIPMMNIDPQLRAGFARMEELTTLSGGEFTASHHASGGTMLRATWKL